MKMAIILLGLLTATCMQVRAVTYDISGYAYGVGTTSGGTEGIQDGSTFTGSFRYSTDMTFTGLYDSNASQYSSAGNSDYIELRSEGHTFRSPPGSITAFVANNNREGLDIFNLYGVLNGQGMFVSFQDTDQTALSSMAIPSSLDLSDWEPHGVDVAMLRLFFLDRSIDFRITSMTQRVPDGGATAALLGLGVLGLAFVRRHFNVS